MAAVVQVTDGVGFCVKFRFDLFPLEVSKLVHTGFVVWLLWSKIPWTLVEDFARDGFVVKTKAGLHETAILPRWHPLGVGVGTQNRILLVGKLYDPKLLPKRCMPPKGACRQAFHEGSVSKVAAIINWVGHDSEFRIARVFRDCRNPLEKYADEQMFYHFHFRWHNVFTSHTIIYFSQKNFKWHPFSHLFDSSRKLKQMTKSKL